MHFKKFKITHRPITTRLEISHCSRVHREPWTNEMDDREKTITVHFDFKYMFYPTGIPFKRKKNESAQETKEK